MNLLFHSRCDLARMDDCGRAHRQKVATPREEDSTPVDCVSSGGDVITKGNMVRVFEGHYDISADAISRACGLLKDHVGRPCSTTSPQGPSNRVLVANSYLMEELINGSSTDPSKPLCKLLRYALGEQDVPRRQSREFYVSRIRECFGKIVGLFHMTDPYKHFMVFEIGLPTHEEGPFLKVWDGMDTWANETPETVPEIQAILELFFTKEERADLPVYIVRAPGDPLQTGGRGCGAFAFIVMCHLAQGEVPKGWTNLDDAMARNYLWGCLMRSRILSLPRRRRLTGLGANLKA